MLFWKNLKKFIVKNMGLEINPYHWCEAKINYQWKKVYDPLECGRFENITQRGFGDQKYHN